MISTAFRISANMLYSSVHFVNFNASQTQKDAETATAEADSTESSFLVTEYSRRIRVYLTFWFLRNAKPSFFQIIQSRFKQAISRYLQATLPQHSFITN